MHEVFGRAWEFKPLFFAQLRASQQRLAPLGMVALPPSRHCLTPLGWLLILAPTRAFSSQASGACVTSIRDFWTKNVLLLPPQRRFRKQRSALRVAERHHY